MEVHFFAKSDIGQVRSANEDYFLSERIAEEEYLFVVADGMGGHLAGDVASRLASATFLDGYRRLRGAGRPVSEAMLAAVREANSAILKRAAENPAQRGMGTTFSALVLCAGQGFIVHVGDSRVYQVRKNRIRRLTTDHSFVEKLVEEGRISAEEAREHPQKNVLYMSLGAREGFNPEVLPPFAVENGDLYILCSDGLCNMVTDEEIREYSLSYYPEESVEALVRVANAHGGADNITLQIVRVGPIGTVEETRPIRTVKPRSKRVTRLALLLALLVLAGIWVLYRLLFAPSPGVVRTAPVPAVPESRPASVQLLLAPMPEGFGGAAATATGAILCFWDGRCLVGRQDGRWWSWRSPGGGTAPDWKAGDQPVFTDGFASLVMRRHRERPVEVQLLDPERSAPRLTLVAGKDGNPHRDPVSPRYGQNGLRGPVVPVFLTETFWIYRDPGQVYAMRDWQSPGRRHFPIEPLRSLTDDDLLFVRTFAGGVHLICLRGEVEKRLVVVTLTAGADPETDWRWDDINSPRPLAIDYRREHHQVVFWLSDRARVFRERTGSRDFTYEWRGKPVMAEQALLDPSSGDVLLRTRTSEFFIATWRT